MIVKSLCKSDHIKLDKSPSPTKDGNLSLQSMTESSNLSIAYSQKSRRGARRVSVQLANGMNAKKKMDKLAYNKGTTFQSQASSIGLNTVKKRRATVVDF